MSVGRDMFDRIVAPVREQMMLTIVRIVGNTDDAADVLQTALMAVWDSLEAVHRHPNPRAYVLRLCISASYDAVRKRARERDRHVPLDCAATLTSATPSPSAQAVADERVRAIHDAIAALPTHQATALVLREIEGESFDAIARVLDCDEQTARSHVSKAKAALRDKLAAMRREVLS